MATLSLLLVSVVILVSLWVIYYRLTKRLDELENLINELGSMVGEWIDGQTK